MEKASELVRDPVVAQQDLIALLNFSVRERTIHLGALSQCVSEIAIDFSGAAFKPEAHVGSQPTFLIKTAKSLHLCSYCCPIVACGDIIWRQTGILSNEDRSETHPRQVEEKVVQEPELDIIDVNPGASLKRCLNQN